jgi:hypothetical protein
MFDEDREEFELMIPIYERNPKLFDKSDRLQI